MVGIKFSGRLGNQMFQYAFGLMLAKKYNYTTFFIFHKNGINKTILHKYFVLDKFSLIKNFFLKKCFILMKKKRIISIKNSFAFPHINYDKLNQSIISGYFQSENCFKDFSDEIKHSFTIKKKHIERFNKKYHSYFKNNKTIAIHIRRGDYRFWGDDNLGEKNLSLPIAYYNKILQSIPNLSDYKIIIVSDEQKEVIQKDFANFKTLEISSNNLITDFQIIQKADIAIISNSTFSWWAAYLNNKPNKIIYAPKYWLGFKVNKEYPAGIMSVDWKWIEVE